MKKLVQLSLALSAFALFAAPASAQMTMSKGAGHQTAGQMKAMMSECSAMMQEVMADPIVRKRMMAIMQQHMQHSGNASMMGGMQGGNAMQGSKAASDSSSHEHHPTPVASDSSSHGHHPTPVASPAASSSPMAAPSP
jgi:hypothetical protein